MIGVVVDILPDNELRRLVVWRNLRLARGAERIRYLRKLFHAVG